MTLGQIRARADQVRIIPLESVLRLSAGQPDRYDKRKWHTPQGVLSVTGAKFMNWNCGLGGGGAIDLVIHLHHLGFQEAVQWLSRHFPNSAYSEPAPVTPKINLALPPPDPTQLGRIQRYLAQARGIDAALIELLIQSGTLYADHRANAVFLLLGKQNTPVGAELRATTPFSWRGMAPGSRKDLGFFSIPAAHLPLLRNSPAEGRQEIILCESAIDAISCFALHPQHRCISTAGARPNPRWLAPLLDQGFRVYCGFDTDPTGEDMARALINLHPTVQRLRPPQHDWNDALKLRP